MTDTYNKALDFATKALDNLVVDFIIYVGKRILIAIGAIIAIITAAFILIFGIGFIITCFYKFFIWLGIVVLILFVLAVLFALGEVIHDEIKHRND